MRPYLARLSSGALLLFFLCGCGNYFSVRIPYRLPDSRNAAEVKKALSALYIVIRAQPEPEESAIGSLAGALLKQPDLPFSAGALARKIAGALSGPGMDVRAYRVSRSEEKTDPYAPRFAPSGVLEIKLSDPLVSARKEERTSYYLDAEKKRQAVKTEVWEYSASVSADIKLLSAPGPGTLDKFSAVFSVREDRPDNKTAAEDWYRGREEALYADAADKLAGRYASRPVLRHRPVFGRKGDDGAARAAGLARREKWTEAEALWSERLKAGGSWRDMLGLGVAAEVRKDFSAAREYYLRAREAAAVDKDAKAVRWRELLSDVELMLSTGPAAAAPERDWFSVPAAVLPFSDETTSIDGPPMLRTLFYEALKAGGYAVQPLEETDRLLLARGFTQGGQLRAANPAEICGWLGAERLFYGNIGSFGEVMAGVYNRRLIQGKLSLWDLSERDFVWSEEHSVVKVSTPKSLLGGLFSQLARGLLERVKGKPLAYEGSLFASETAETLPTRPGR